MNRDLDHDDLQALRRMLPAPAERDFPPGRRRQHEEHLTASWLRLSRGPGTRRRLLVRIATPLAVATAAVGAFTAFQLSTTVSADRTPRVTASRDASPRPADSPLTNISTAAYTLDREQGDAVRITVRASAAQTADAAQLQKDLATMGLRTWVTRGRTQTSSPITYTLAMRDKNGDFVAVLSRTVLSRNGETVVFSREAEDTDALTVTLGGA
ncbi:hypothetical protein [Streptomyces sp. NPDC088733]|uniref:hypothetical protein n=1 Tax=Streptomyces sp. NPDC088733 TaxID=3365880 RepID=UPI00380F0EB2